MNDKIVGLLLANLKPEATEGFAQQWLTMQYWFATRATQRLRQVAYTSGTSRIKI